MANSTHKEPPIVIRIAEHTGLHRRHVGALLREVTGAISQWLAEDETVIIRGIGLFKKREHYISPGNSQLIKHHNTRRVNINFSPSTKFILKSEADDER